MAAWTIQKCFSHNLGLAWYTPITNPTILDLPIVHTLTLLQGYLWKRYWKSPSPDCPVSTTNIQVCNLFAVQGGWFWLLGFPPDPLLTALTPSMPLPSQKPQWWPRTRNEAYLQHADVGFNSSSYAFNQSLSPLGSQKGATPSDTNQMLPLNVDTSPNLLPTKLPPAFTRFRKF